MNVEVKTLSEMTLQEWCRLAEERIKVFVVEQECPYQEIDEQDYQAHHLMLKDERGELVGCELWLRIALMRLLAAY